MLLRWDGPASLSHAGKREAISHQTGLAGYCGSTILPPRNMLLVDVPPERKLSGSIQLCCWRLPRSPEGWPKANRRLRPPQGRKTALAFVRCAAARVVKFLTIACAGMRTNADARKLRRNGPLCGSVDKRPALQLGWHWSLTMDDGVPSCLIMTPATRKAHSSAIPQMCAGAGSRPLYVWQLS
jgi:hypothetical protein